MKNTNDIFQGILISLKKRMTIDFDSNDTKISDYQYLIWGHYAGIDISMVDRWVDFKPSEVQRKSGRLSLQDDILDVYTLKACVPESRLLQKLVSSGFNYDIWKGGVPPVRWPDERFPFIACTLIHLTDYYIAEKTQNDVMETIGDHIFSTGIDMEELNCSIFYSLGFSDIILLFRISDFEKVNRVLIALDQLELNGKKMISDSYTIIGMKNDMPSDLKEIKRYLNNTKNFSPVVKFSMAFSIKQNMDSFVVAFQNEMDSFFDELGLQCPIVMKKGNTFCRFGNADAVIVSEVPLDVLRVLFIKNDDMVGPMHKESALMKDFVFFSQTNVLIPFQTKLGHCNECNRDKIYRTFQAEQDFISFFNKSLGEFGISHRSADAITQILESYYNLLCSGHGGELEGIFKRAFEALKKNLEIDFACIRELKGYEETAIEVACNQYRLRIRDMLGAIDVFRKYVGDYLSDLSRSDRSFIEGRNMAHASIGSLTKLLFSYNRYINALAAGLSNNGNFAFLVVSGGCDTTEVEDIFNHIPSDTQSYYPLYIITIPEICLFDIRGTYFRLSHECYHCFGERKRMRRFELAMLALEEFIGIELEELLFSDMLLGIDVVVGERMHEANDYLNKKRSEFNVEFMGNIRKRNDILIMELCRETKENHSMSSEQTVNKMIQIMAADMMFSSDSIGEGDSGLSSLFYDVCQMYFRCLKDIWRYFLKNNVVKEECRSGIVSILSDLEYHLINKTPTTYIEDSYFSLVKRFFIYMQSEKELRAYEKAILQKEGTSLSFIGIKSYSDLSKIIVETMCECFADCMAIHSLGMGLEDFLLSFGYELQDVDMAFPFNIAAIFRLGVDIHVCFGEDGILDGERLSEDSEKKICQAFDSSRNDVSLSNQTSDMGSESENVNGYTLDGSVVVERINELLISYAVRYQKIGQHIETYVKECISENNKKLAAGDAYKAVSCTHEISTKDVYRFLDYNKRLAKEESDASN